MRALVVTSSITFVPENYNRLVCGLATHPHIVGMVELDNREPSILAKGLGMFATLSAPRLGLTLIRNYLGQSSLKREEAYKKADKFFKALRSINSPEALKLIQDEKIDLIINARTRSIFKKDILEAPRLGCINIHHGLLPQQRGLMCDFWAHLEGEDFGFSVHQMTSKIDDGPILHVQKVETSKTNYLESILRASEIEKEVCDRLLDQISIDDKITPLQLNIQNIKYRKNPSLTDGYRLQLKGVKI